MSTKIPILSVYDENGNQIEIPAIRGKSAYAYAVDGGYTGTEEEFAEKLAFLMGYSVFGYVDSDNNIIVQGDLGDGKYSVKYEMADGSTVDIGDLVLDSNVYYSVVKRLTNCTISNDADQAIEGQSYSATVLANSGYSLSSVTVTMGGTDISSTAVSGGVINIATVTGDILITAVADEIVVAYTNILTSGDYTVQLNKRWSSSSKAYADCNGMISIIVPKVDVLNKKIRFKGFTKDLKASNQSPIWMQLDETNTRIGSLATSDTTGNLWMATNLIDNGDGVYGIEMTSANWGGVLDNTANFVLNMAVNTSAEVTSLDDLIMTIDEEIV